MDKSKELEFESTGKLLLKYFIPAFIGLIVYALYNVVDRVFIGQVVGTAALSGLTLVYPIMMIIMAFGTLTGVGAGVLVSINMGKKDIDKAESILGTSFLTQIIISLLVMALGFALKNPMLDWLEPQALTRGYAVEYLDVILMGTIFQTAGWGMNNILRAQGYAKLSMYSMIISALTNVVLDAVFVIGFDMGVFGAALATIISMVALTVWVIYHLTKPTTFVKLKLKYIRFHFNYIKEIFAIGFGSFAIHIAASAVQMIMNDQLIIYGGDTAVATIGVISSVSMFFFMSVFGLNMASQPIIGYNYGAKLMGRVKSTLKLTIFWATVISIIAFLVGELMPGTLIKLFNSNDPELLELGVRGMRICFILYPLIGFQVVVSNYFQSIGKSMQAAILSLLRQVIILIPAFLILPKFYGLDGIWLSWPLSDLLAAIITFFMLTYSLKKHHA